MWITLFIVKIGKDNKDKEGYIPESEESDEEDYDDGIEVNK